MQKRASDAILDLVKKDKAAQEFRELHSTASFREYLDLATADPRIARNAYQRVYDMVLSHGTDEVVERKEKMIRYRFFSDPLGGGRDAVYGIEHALMKLVAHLKGAAAGYGSERRILLLHGPVGSSKSTIARLLKRGLEAYTRTKEGALWMVQWRMPGRETWEDCPMHEEPLRLLPVEARAEVEKLLNERLDAPYSILRA